jgi:hypothetical protein
VLTAVAAQHIGAGENFVPIEPHSRYSILLACMPIGFVLRSRTTKLVCAAPHLKLPPETLDLKPTQQASATRGFSYGRERDKPGSLTYM